ncbi:MAG: 2-oxoglutarate dehydrogenase E1 component [Bacteroides sp.]|nr:MAG: 2-oxoglutarate dehydrogenase E1 component [Bacteroides sp.]
MNKFSYLSNIDGSYINNLYHKYKENKSSINIEWQKFFEGYELGLKKDNSEYQNKEFISDKLISYYRNNGYKYANNNPLFSNKKINHNKYDINENNINTIIYNKDNNYNNISLKYLIKKLENIYCGSLSIEYDHINDDSNEKKFLTKIFENIQNFNLNKDDQLLILHDIIQATDFEIFLTKKFIGQKFFSLLGAESIIPAINFFIRENMSKYSSKRIVMAMSHRGRLNVLANVLGKPYEDIFSEFNNFTSYNKDTFNNVKGDVKYHLGYLNNNIILLPNPSHLEVISSVAQGFAKSLIENQYLNSYKSVIPLIIHGDASISGQGIVYELAQMSKLNPYYTGGTIHVVINNQVGFTTDAKDYKSSDSCTDISKVIKAPVLHVNSEDVLSVIYAFKIGLEYRYKFNNDIYIDLISYRRYGHNEMDEPKFTQPYVYKEIEQHKSIKNIFIEKILKDDKISESDINEIKDNISQKMNISYNKSRNKNLIHVTEDNKKYIFDGDTNVLHVNAIKCLNEYIDIILKHNFDKKIHKIFNKKHDLLTKNNKVDWGLTENFTYISIIQEGYNVRLIGQDTKRGTFSHRHGSMISLDDNNEIIPINLLNNNKAKFYIYNSTLSEYAALGFEYGYSLNYDKKNITIWEAQFGDFVNGAQIIIDQFIASAKSKWNQLSNIVLLLPHGYEGQGPEHSSARIERFMELCSDNNMQIINCSTPVQYFHAIRRQIKSHIPLIIFTPKSLLRHPECVSKVSDLEYQKKFCKIIDDSTTNELIIKKLIFCSGKIYYDLLEIKNKYEFNNIALIRLEQIYPFPNIEFNNIINKYKNSIEILWVQEEPSNMGLCSYLSDIISKYNIKVISRNTSNSVSTGNYKIHVYQQYSILSKTFDININKILKDYNIF